MTNTRSNRLLTNIGVAGAVNESLLMTPRQFFFCLADQLH
jgi:hypothetical protein